MEIAPLLAALRACEVCASSLPFGARPIVQAGAGTRLLIVSQAPGKRAHDSGMPWTDASGDRLRAWLGLDAAQFYDPERVGIMPMAFCYPGVAASGGDAPPPRVCAPLWHQRLRTALPAVKLMLLVGGYAQRAYLPGTRSMTSAVQGFANAPAGVFPLPHPSWRCIGWMQRNPWFETDVLPALRANVRAALG